MTETATHYSSSPIITILVGKDPEHLFQVHEDLLIRSPFFAACLNNDSDFVEGQTKTIKLPDDSPAVVTHFIDWLYTGKCPIAHSLKDLERQLGCADIFAFGDKTCTEAYCNDIMDAWIGQLKEMGGYVSPNLLAMAYRHGLKGTMLSQFGLKSAVWMASTHPENFMQTSNAYHTDWFEVPELVKDFTTAMLDLKLKKWSNPRRVGGCLWHQHTGGSKCGKA